MLRVAVEDVQNGMVLARPIAAPTDPRRTLLPRNAEVPSDLVPHLRTMGIREIWVRCNDLEFVEQLICEEACHHQRELYFQVRRNFERVMGQATVDLDLSHFQKSIADLFDFLQRVPLGSLMLEKVDAFDDYLMSHSTNVCYVAMLVGMKLESYLGLSPGPTHDSASRDLRLLGLGCLLHDIGKIRISPDILNKPGKLTPEEFEIMKRHPIIGHEMLADQAPPAVADIVLNHHQRWDGNGYPSVRRDPSGELRPLKSHEISVFSRIATMADIYDAATSKRCYSDAKPPVQVLHEMRTWCRGAFDPVVEQAFYEVIPAFPIGQQVTLSNGMRAVVVDFNSHEPACPKVQCLFTPDDQRFADPSQEEIDLAVERDISIVAVGGVDVRPYLDSQRCAVSATAAPAMAAT